MTPLLQISPVAVIGVEAICKVARIPYLPAGDWRQAAMYSFQELAGIDGS